MATAPKYFQRADRVVSHNISSSPSIKSVPSNTRSTTASKSSPAPLVVNTGCASCKKRR